jgi:ribulose-phosphate 3-epimerase
MVEIIPSILTASPQEAKEMLLKADEACGKAQIDIVDGVFAANKTIDPSAIAGFETNLSLDFHLMTKEPIDWVERALHAGAERIIGQVELMTDQAAFVGKVQEGGTLVGLALDIDTPVSRIDKEILTSLDTVLVMSVKAGEGGQQFDKRVMKKIKILKEVKAKDETPFRICVDGGITQENIKKVTLAGADEVAIGRRLFEGNIRENIEKYAQD